MTSVLPFVNSFITSTSWASSSACVWQCCPGYLPCCIPCCKPYSWLGCHSLRAAWFVNLFFCHICLLKLTCSDIYINALVIFILEGPITVIPFLLIFVSYVQILSSILKASFIWVINKVFSNFDSCFFMVSLFIVQILVPNYVHQIISLLWRRM